MAQEMQAFTATIPAGTPKSAPVIVQIPTSVRIVSQIDWRVPAGPSGVFGWNISMGGVKVFPLGNDTYVVADNEHGSWPVINAPTSGAWEVIGYNTGANPHSVYIVMHCDPVIEVKAETAPIPSLSLMPAPDLSMLGPPVRRRM